MRNEKQMMKLITDIALEDQNIRAVYMNGSRTNPSVVRDDYMDYDVVYVVCDLSPFTADRTWLKAFGDPLIVQEPDSPEFGWGKDCDPSLSYAWLMLFTDGIRVDLTLKAISVAVDDYLSDSLTVRILDKDNLLPEIPSPNDSGYHITPPTEQTFRGCVNEFRWCLNNIAKGIARDQLSYVMRMYYSTVHKELERMVDWYIAMEHGYAITFGMWGKYYKKHLPETLYSMFLRTYPSADYGLIWKAVFTACELFERLAESVAHQESFEYDSAEGKNVMLYLRDIQNGGFGDVSRSIFR